MTRPTWTETREQKTDQQVYETALSKAHFNVIKAQEELDDALRLIKWLQKNQPDSSLRLALEKIASAERRVERDTVDIAQQALRRHPLP